MKDKLVAMLSLAILCTSPLFAEKSTYSVWTTDGAKGQNYTDADGVFQTFAVPDDYPHLNGTPRFNVSVDDKAYVGLYNDNNYWGGNVAFGAFDFEDGKTVEVEIASRSEIQSFEILPHKADVEAVQSSDKSVHLKISKANQQLTLVINDAYQKDVLHLFCNAIDHDAPDIDAPNGYKYDTRKGIHYFGPGYHDLTKLFSNGALTIRGDKKIYVAGGAVVDGQLTISGGKGAKIYGHGLIMNAEPKIVASITRSENCSVEGVMIHGHRAQCWCTTIDNSSNINFDNVKIITTRYASTDGLDVMYCSDCTFNNTFIRSCDDAIAIKAMGDAAPSTCPPNKNLIFTNMQLWNDCNNAFGMGAETRASAYENIQLRDSEILFSYDDPYVHEQLDERSTMNICALQGTYFKDILFENIYVNRCERLIAMGFKGDFWFGSIQGDQSFPGGISGVTFRNITAPSNSGSSIANQIHLYGWHKEGTPDKFVENITFDKVVIEGQLLENENSPYIVTNNTPELQLVKDLKFLNSQGGIQSADSAQPSAILSATMVRKGEPIEIRTSDNDVNWSIYSISGQLSAKGNSRLVSTTDLTPAVYLMDITGKDLHRTVKFQVR